jgi:hypothetical protein
VRGARAIAALQRAELDAVVMLAGGLLPDGGLPEWVTRRLDTAYDVHLLQQRRCPILLLGARRVYVGGYGRPCLCVLSASGFGLV